MKTVPSLSRKISSAKTLTPGYPEPEVVFSGSAGSTSTVNDNDVMVEIAAGAYSAVTEVQFASTSLDASVNLELLTPTLADVVGERLMVKGGVTSGHLRANYRPSPSGPKISFAVSIGAPSAVKRALGYAVGQAGKIVGDEMDTVLGGAVVDVDLFSAATYPTAWTRSLTHWAADYDFTGCVAATNAPQTPRGRRGGALITPRHIAWCAHFGGNGAGTLVYFVDNDNVVHVRSILAQHTSSGSDRKISLLNADLPASITPYKVFGDMTGAFPQPVAHPEVTAPGLLGVWVDQYERVYLVSVTGFYGSQSVTVNGNPHTTKKVSCTHPSDHPTHPAQLAGANADFAKIPISGDSGSPVLVPYNGELHLCCSWEGASNGGSFADQEDLLNDIILELDASAGVSTGHTVTATSIA